MVLKEHCFHEIIYYLQGTSHVLRNNPEEVLKKLREIGQLIDAYVPNRNGHSLRVSEYALAIARELGFNEKELVLVEIAVLLQDIGKVGFDEEMLSKPRLLTKTEIEKQTLIGDTILTAFTDISQIFDSVENRHEFWGGFDYSYDMRGNSINLINRILEVADAYDAMTAQYSTRRAWTKEHAIRELEKNAGIQFDAHIVEVFKKILTN